MGGWTSSCVMCGGWLYFDPPSMWWRHADPAAGSNHFAKPRREDEA